LLIKSDRGERTAWATFSTYRRLFSAGAKQQCDFEERIGRMLGDQKSNCLRTRLDFSYTEARALLFVRWKL
jgi:hypothetical protein